MKLRSMSVSRVLSFYRPMAPRRCVRVDEALRLVGSNAVKLAKTRQPHGQSPAWRRIDVIVQALERCQNVVQTESVRDTRDLAKGRMGFDGIHIGRPGREDQSFLLCRKFGIAQDIVW
jgi:hypothetical protein